MDINEAEMNTIPVSIFEIKSPQEIFSDVKKCGAMTVTKDGVPQCIMLSPEEYARLKDELEIARLENDLSDELDIDNELLDEPLLN